MKKALISVTDKRGIVDFAKDLLELDYQIISTGGTYKLLNENGLVVNTIESLTGFNEILDGRVKTLNPKIHGGILFKRNNHEHRQTIIEQEIESIDLVCVNLYQFQEALERTDDEDEIIEEIDIGGPTLIRAAAKNYQDVVVVTSPNDYNDIIDMLREDRLEMNQRRNLAAKAFAMISEYDKAISDYFNGNGLNERLELELVKKLSYGENPHQKAYLYRKCDASRSIMDFEQLWGKEMSFNNYNDSYSALETLYEFKDEPYFCTAIKHGTICCAAIGESTKDSYLKSYKNDSISIFGGIAAFNSLVDQETALELVKIFLEIIIAPDFTDDALEILKSKKNLRILKYNSLEFVDRNQYKDLDGHMLKQERDMKLIEELNTVTIAKEDKNQREDMIFALKIAKSIKSNAIVIAKNKEVLALCGGQTARIYAVWDALLNYAGKDFNGAVLASDAFFPFKDSAEAAYKAGIKAIIQPGGSRNDQESIDFCNEKGMVMIITGLRHFKH